MGTPGRVLDLVNRGFLKLNNLKFFILDECDKMLLQLGKALIQTCDKKFRISLRKPLRTSR